MSNAAIIVILTMVLSAIVFTSLGYQLAVHFDNGAWIVGCGVPGMLAGTLLAINHVLPDD